MCMHLSRNPVSLIPVITQNLLPPKYLAKHVIYPRVELSSTELFFSLDRPEKTHIIDALASFHFI